MVTQAGDGFRTSQDNHAGLSSLGHESYQTTMDMYGTISIDEMQEIAAQKFREE